MSFAGSPETTRATAATRYFHLSAIGGSAATYPLTDQRPGGAPTIPSPTPVDQEQIHQGRPAVPRYPANAHAQERFRFRPAGAANDRLIGGHKPDELTHEDQQVAAIADKSRRRER